MHWTEILQLKNSSCRILHTLCSQFTSSLPLTSHPSMFSFTHPYSACRFSFVYFPSGGEGGCPWCAAGCSLYGWRWHSAFHQWRVWPTVAVGTLLSLGLLWWKTVSEQTGPGLPWPGRPAGHVWGPGMNVCACCVTVTCQELIHVNTHSHQPPPSVRTCFMVLSLTLFYLFSAKS